MMYMYKYLRDVIFELLVPVGQLQNLHLQKFHWQNFGLYQLESRIHVSDYV